MTTRQLEKATFGGGCFWCVEALFQNLRGVQQVASGYSGGHTENPTYEEVCSGTTGHAEVIQITFDPREISYEQLLEVFWNTHDPTTLNRQGADVGTQYRSVIFYHNQEQRRTAEASGNKLSESGVFNDPIVTEISPYKEFYRAETYHQNYYRNNPGQMYCAATITPKLKKFFKEFSRLLKEEVKG